MEDAFRFFSPAVKLVLFFIDVHVNYMSTINQ